MNKIIIDDAENIANTDLPWDNMNNKTIIITGANGYVPSYFIHSILKHNDLYRSNINVIALCRNQEKAIKCFEPYLKRHDFILDIQDVCDPIHINKEIHFFIHAASPAGYHLRHEKPADTYKANVIGCLNLLDLSSRNPTQGFLFISSVDIYGQTSNNIERLSENNYGYINPLNQKNAYSMGKLAAEALCISYYIQYGIPISIVRPFQIIGPGIALNDGRLHADFIAQLLEKNKITLKGDGTPKRTFMYITDAITGMLLILLKGTRGEAYNLCDESSEVSVFELAETMASFSSNKPVSIEFDKTQQSTPAVRAALPCVVGNSTKLQKLGWLPKMTLEEGIRRLLQYYGLVTD
jgi:nucleoside-diphosphate-sugar epimerase